MKINVSLAVEIEQITSQLVVNFRKRVGEDLSLPIPIQLISEKLYKFQVEVEEFRFKYNNVRGLMIPELKLIIANSYQSDKSLWFTIAHELAHWLLVPLISKRKASLKDFRLMVKNTRSYEVENLANYIAGAYLIPYPALLYLVNGDLTKISAEKKVDLQNQFQVSKETLDYRINDLRFLFEHKFLEEKDPTFVKIGHLKTKVNRVVVHKKTIVDLRYKVIDNRTLRKLAEYKEHSLNLQILMHRDNYPSRMSTFRNMGLADDVIVYGREQDKKAHLKDERQRNKALNLRVLDNRRWISWVRGNFSRSDSNIIVFARKGESVELEMSVLPKTELSKIISPRVILLSKKEARKFIVQKQKSNKSVVLIVGEYDSITDHDMAFFAQAKRHGDLLVVGLDTNSNQRRGSKKGQSINDVYQRFETISQIPLVDFVFIIHESAKTNAHKFYEDLFGYLRPNLIVSDANKASSIGIKTRAKNARIFCYSIVPTEHENETDDPLTIPALLDEAIKNESVVIVKLAKLEEFTLGIKYSWRQIKLPGM